MAKKIFKSISIGIMVFAIALLSGYVAYVIAYNHQNELTKERMTADGIVEAMPASQNAMPDYRERVKADYYLARFENNDISIYMVTGDEEIFMYCLNIYSPNLPAEDMIRLKEGVIIADREELVSFEEDYTS